MSDGATTEQQTSGFTKSRQSILAEHLAPQLAQIFGYNALLYTPLAKVLCGDELCIKNQVVINHKKTKRVSLLCRFEELPIASDSIDLALLPAILQRSEFPHQVLREVERVLIPEGAIILIGRNPFSWQGVKTLYKDWRRNKRLHLRDISRKRINDWFQLLGLETETEISISATNNRLQNSNAYQWVKSIGQTFCDYFCSYYIIIARKRVSTMTPIRPSWRRNKQLVPSRLAEPSVKSQVDSWFKQLK